MQQMAHAVLLDFLPASHQYLLSTLSTWWSLGHVMTNLVRAALSFFQDFSMIMKTQDRLGFHKQLFL